MTVHIAAWAAPVPTVVRVITRPEAELEDRIDRALVAGVCSTCEALAPSPSLDASGRCPVCQP